jgi:RNA polymerase sigma-70 factor, ECF subfamily
LELEVLDRGQIKMSWKKDGQGLEYLEYIDGLFAYAVVLTRNHAEAEDLVQETYVRAMQAMGRLRPESNVKGWLFTILRNVWLNQLRKVRNGPQMIEMEAEDGVASSVVEPSRNSHDLYVSKVEAEQVRAAIQELPEKFREIILLREYEDLSYQEIARVLNCPVGTVMSRLGRARAMLRVVLVEVLTKSASNEVTGVEMKERNNSYSTSENKHHPTTWAGC